MGVLACHGRVAPLAVLVVALAPLLCAPLAACTPPAGAPPGEAGLATVVEVVDGDTVEVEVSGATETVRLLGIDTPETVHPDKPVECWGPEASARTEALLPTGSSVRLERDEEARDRFGRLLAYVRRADDGTFVNERLVAEGFARTLLIEPNHAYATALLDAQDTARETGAGLWSACPAAAADDG